MDDVTEGQRKKKERKKKYLSLTTVFVDVDVEGDEENDCLDRSFVTRDSIRG